MYVFWEGVVPVGEVVSSEAAGNAGGDGSYHDMGGDKEFGNLLASSGGRIDF